MIITRQDKNGVKPLLQTGEFGYDNYPAGGDSGRVYVGTGSVNIPLAKKAEMSAVDGKADVHIARVDNPHGVTKAQVGLGNADNTSDNVKNVLSAIKWTTARTITLSGDVSGSASVDGSANVTITTAVQPNSVALGTDTTGNYMIDITAGSGISVSHTQGEGSIATITNSEPNVITDITTTHNSTNVVVNSSDGTDGTINSATQTLAGVMSAADKTKLDGIEVGATADQTGAEIKSLYESNANTNALTDTLLALLTTKKVKNVSTDALNDKLVITYTDDTVSNLNINDIITDIHVSGASLDATSNVLTLTSADGGADVTVDLSDFVNSSELTTALNTAVKLTGNQTIAGVKTFSSNIVGNITGNAGTATKLHTPININGVAFDGSADITVSDSTAVKLTGNQTIAGVKTFSSNIVGNITGNAGTATTLQTARTINGVAFDGSSNIIVPVSDENTVNLTENQTIGGIKTFSSTISGSITGNSGTATKLATARTINGVAFDGSSNIIVPVSDENTVNLTENQTIGGIKTFSSTVVGSITGNSATATKLQTARLINGVAFDGTGNITAPTNLGITAGTTAGPIVTSSTGTNATLPTASGTASGVVTTGNQTIAGIKTFSSSPIVPTPILGGDAVNKDYVDVEVTGANNYTDSRVNDVVSQLSTDYYQGAYGIQWDYATDTYIRIGAKGYTAIQSLMRRCVVKADGTVNYYLNPDNSNFKEDDTPSVLTGADGNVMVEIPKHYIKVETVGNINRFSVSLTLEPGYILDPAFLKWNGTAMVEVPYRYFRAYEGFVSGGKLLSVSGVTPTKNQTISVFRTQAMANGAGWHLTDWNLLNTIKRLCYIEFCDFIVTKYLGEGNNAGGDHGITTGQSNALGNRSSNSTHNDKYMSYRGIENMYADIWKFVDGVNVNNYQFYVNGKYSTFQSDVFTGDYVAKGPLTVTATNSLIKRCAVSADGGFIPTVVGGSTITFYGDALWTVTGARIVIYGGNANNGTSGGLGALAVHNTSSVSSEDVGAAVCR